MPLPSFDSLVYDVLVRLRDPKGCIKGYVENMLRDAGITVFLVDDEDQVFLQKASIRSMVNMVLVTPEFLESQICCTFLKKEIGRNNNRWLTVYCGVSFNQVMAALFPTLTYFLATQKRTFTDDQQIPTLTSHSQFPSHLSFSLPLDFWNKKSSHMANLGLSMLQGKSFHDLPRHLVGLPLRVRELLNILGLKYILSDETTIVGIWGEGGIGKSTMAKTIYDRIGGNFEGKSFLSNIEHVLEKDHGEVLLIKQFISDISETKLDEINALMHEQMEQVLCGKRVFIVFDDVNSEFQVEYLCRNMKWCGKGSLIFITARNKAIFEDSVDISYEMKRLNDEESLQLFCLHAFKKLTPTNGFKDISNQISKHCEELPLVLEVLGSLLYNKTKKEWETIYNSMVRIPRGQMQKKLTIICDLLTDIEKDLFFNITSFHFGQTKHSITQQLKGSRFPMQIGMSSLMEHNLVKVINDKLYVSLLLRETAMDISPKKAKLKYIYDVFLSFRGDDTRKSFTSHLCAALKQAGIKVYMDEDRIERGVNISSSLLEAIERSRISIIVFSKNYADSSWCLQELEKIMECYKTNYQVVLPIFLDVHPSEVRKQQNAFGKAWQRFIKRSNSSIKMEKWTENIRKVLKEVANLSGWDMHKYRFY